MMLFNKNRRLMILGLVFSLALMLVACDDEPLFTELSSNRLKIKISGTYFSSIGQSWSGSATADNPLVVDDSVDDVTMTGVDSFPTDFYIDIAEMRITDIDDVDYKISNYRQLFTAKLDGSDDNGANFFGSGSARAQGVELVTDDPVPDKEYKYLKIYLRKMIFNGVTTYTMGSDGWTKETESPWKTIYNEVYQDNIFDFNPFQMNSKWDSLREEASTINHVFPLVVPIYGENGKGLVYSRDDRETVLNVRMVLKNFIKKYEFDYINSDGNRSVVHYYGVSDWLNGTTANENKLGGNIHAVATATVADRSGTINGSGATTDNIVIAIPSSMDIGKFELSEALTGDYGRGFSCDLPVAPDVLSGTYSMDNVLDYYLKYEKYRYDWSTRYSACGSWSNYEKAWDKYYNNIKDFIIAPYITVADSNGEYEFVNVPNGSYKIYHVADVGYGKLPSTGFTQIGTAVTVP